MRTRSQSDGRPQVEAAGGEPQAPPVPAALQGEQQPGGRADYKAELEFEALVSSGETRRYILTPKGVHVRAPSEDENKTGREGPETDGPDRAGNPVTLPFGVSSPLTAGAQVPTDSHGRSPSPSTESRMAETEKGKTGSESEMDYDARGKTKLLADLLKRTGLGGAWPKNSPAQTSQGSQLPVPPAGEVVDAASRLPTDNPTSRSREMFVSTFNADGIQSAPAEAGLLDPSSLRAIEKLWRADTDQTGPETAKTEVLPVLRNRRRSLSQSGIVADVAESSKEHAQETPRRSSSLSNRASRRGIGTGAKVIDPPSRSSSRSKQRRAEPASEESAATAVGAPPNAPETEAGPGPAANADTEPQGEEPAKVAGHPETIAHDLAPDAIAAEVATEKDVRQVPQEQEQTGREHQFAEIMPPNKLCQAFGVTSAEPPSAAAGTLHQKSEITPFVGAGANATADICASGKDWRAECLPVALSKVESVAQSAQRLAEENAHLKKEIIDIQRSRQLENLRFERLSFAAYRKLTEITADKAALETEATYLRNSLAELTAMIHLVDSGLPSQPAQPKLRSMK